MTPGKLFKGVFKLVSIWLDKGTKNKIKIESGNGTELLMQMMGDEHKIPDFLGGKGTHDLRLNPGTASAELQRVVEQGLVLNEDTRDLKRFFWDVDLSKKGNEFGAKSTDEDPDG